MSWAEIYIYSLVFILGLVIGSFLNVVAIRLLKGEDFVFKRSHCTRCGEKISWYDNIPILSYLILGGKCRHCTSHISIQYPVVEFVTGLLFLAVFHYWQFSLATLFLFFLISNFIVITLTDLKEHLIYDINSVPLIPIGLLYNFFDIGGVSQGTTDVFGFAINEVFISALIGAAIGAAFFEIFSRIGYVLSGEYAFGEGDTILGAALGAWFGWKALILILILSLFVQMIVGIPIIFYNAFKSKEYKLILGFSGLFVALGFSFLGRYLSYVAQYNWSIASILTGLIVGGVSVFVIFKRMREAQSYTFMPFGPPLIVAALIVLFAGDNIALHLPFIG